MEKRCGWDSDFQTLVTTSPRIVRDSLASFVKDCSSSQLGAWDESIPILQTEGQEAIGADKLAAFYTAILEYQLPLESRRPDVIVLENGAVLVIEFKSKAAFSQADIDQVAAYARDLRCYHGECAERPVHPILVPTRWSMRHEERDGVHIVSPDRLDSLINMLSAVGAPAIDPIVFLRPDAYRPLPTLVKAARELFESGTLRNVWRANAATEPATRALTEIVHEAARTKTRKLVLLTGIPGSGKTLVGLRIVHAGFLDGIAVPRATGRPTAPAVFLSGNDPLVEVLQYELRKAGGSGKTFVRGVKEYVAAYSKRPDAIPPEHLLVFDEAQRAWDAAQVAEKHGALHAKSEPEHFIEFAERIPEWCVVLGLIGSGQEIHKGEEGGLVQWKKAIENSAKKDNWTICFPPFLSNIFSGEGLKLQPHDALSLDKEIRYHLTPEIHTFVDGLLHGAEPSKLSAKAAELFSAGFRLHITRDLNVAKEYAQERYSENPDARFGLLASARDKDLAQFGIPNSFQDTKNFRVGPWYSEGAKSPLSCRHLDKAATEFQAQGLELDLAILCWGTDFARCNGNWSAAKARGFKRGSVVRDPFQLRLNSYRVLLTRGRDGAVVFVPALAYLDETYAYLVNSGFRQLSQA